VDQTWNVSVLTLRVLWKMVTGQASLKNISGPITIAEFAGVSALIGVAAFLSFLGLLSVSLGVINLLPVPVLDGGHLLFYFIEIVKGSPLSEGAEAFGQRIGLTLLGGLMFVAFYNDITRLFT
jgi:regulator of sigma E protease